MLDRGAAYSTLLSMSLYSATTRKILCHVPHLWTCLILMLLLGGRSAIAQGTTGSFNELTVRNLNIYTGDVDGEYSVASSPVPSYLVTISGTGSGMSVCDMAKLRGQAAKLAIPVASKLCKRLSVSVAKAIARGAMHGSGTGGVRLIVLDLPSMPSFKDFDVKVWQMIKSTKLGVAIRSVIGDAAYSQLSPTTSTGVTRAVDMVISANFDASITTAVRLKVARALPNAILVIGTLDTRHQLEVTAGGVQASSLLTGIRYGIESVTYRQVLANAVVAGHFGTAGGSSSSAGAAAGGNSGSGAAGAGASAGGNSGSGASGASASAGGNSGSGAAGASASASGNSGSGGTGPSAGQSGTTANTGVTSIDANGKLDVIGVDGKYLSQGWPAIEPVNVTNRISPTSTVTLVDGGVDIKLTFTNSTSVTSELASVLLPSFDFAQPDGGATVRDFHEIGQEMSIAVGDGHGWHRSYPRCLYSPLLVMSIGASAVGVAVEYPILDYRHDIRLGIKPTSDGSWRVSVGFENSNHGGSADEYLFNKPTLEPGAQRHYTVRLRVTRVAQWTESLAPYRSYFRNLYGDVRYVRDPRPVSGVLTAMTGFQSASNPLGWVPNVGRPESDGYSTLVMELDRRMNIADRILVWSPSGLENGPTARNYPFKFCSRWTDSEIVNTPLANGPAAIRQFTSRFPGEFGLWWGNSTSIASQWGGVNHVPLTVQSPSHMSAMFAELDPAVSTGASLIGLDAFSHAETPLWELYGFLLQAKARHPNVKFCSEGRCCDILHTLAPTWIDGYRIRIRPGAELLVTSEPFLLANFLLPGNETWSGMLFDRSGVPDLAGETSVQSSQEAAIAKVAANGYIPVVFLDTIDLRAPAFVSSGGQGPLVGGSTLGQ